MAALEGLATPTTVNATRPARSGLDLENPQLANTIRAQVTEYNATLFRTYLGLPTTDMSDLLPYVSPNGDLVKQIETEKRQQKADGTRFRRGDPHVFVFEVGKITLLDPTHVRVWTCVANNLIEYTAGPPESIVDDRLITVVLETDFVLIDGAWKDETQRNKRTRDGQHCEDLPR